MTGGYSLKTNTYSYKTAKKCLIYIEIDHFYLLNANLNAAKYKNHGLNTYIG